MEEEHANVLPQALKSESRPALRRGSGSVLEILRLELIRLLSTETSNECALVQLHCMEFHFTLS